MRILFVIGAAAILLASDATSGAHARWCAWYDAYTYTCGFQSFGQCQATVQGAGGYCRRDVQRRSDAPGGPPLSARAQSPAVNAPAISPPRPAWASPYECYYDEGYGRFRSCNAGGSVP
jgi:hypothetical protein